jgi:hypothetical protein
MLRKTGIELDGRTNVVATRIPLKNVNPGHNEKCQRGESNSRPRAYESPALPLSYPGIKLIIFAERPLTADQPRKLSGLLYR